MGIAGDLWGSLANPGPTLRDINATATLTQGAFLVIVATAISGAIAGGLVAMLATTKVAEVFFNVFLSTFATGILTFIAVIVLIHIFLHALEKPGDIAKFVPTLAFPYSAIILLSSLLLVITTGIAVSGARGELATYAILFLSFVTVAVSIYAYILYTIAAKEAYRTGVAMAAVVVVLAMVTTTMLVMMTQVMSMFGSAGTSLFASVL